MEMLFENNDLCVVVFGWNFMGFQPVVVKFIVAEMNPPTLVSFRYLLLSATLFLLYENYT